MSEDFNLDSNISLDGEELTAVVEDPENTRILGYAVMYTVGSDESITVPRDWLIDRTHELGIDSRVLPNEPWPSSAYKRAMNRLIDDTTGDGNERVWIQAPRLDDPDREEPHRVDLSLKSGDGKQRHLYAEVFFPEEECGQSGGKWVNHHLGRFDYNAEGQQPSAFKDDDLSESDLLHDVWSAKRSQAFNLFDQMQEHHIGHDIRQMMYYTTRDYTTSVVPLRDGGAVYFFPAGMSDFVQSMSTLYDEIGQKFKVGGAEMAVRTIPILDTEEQREWIQQRVESVLNESVESALEEAWEEFDEGDTAEEVVKSIKENLVEGEETAEVYNALLQTQLDLEELLSEQRKSLDDEAKEDIINRVMAQTDFDQF